MNQRPFGLSIVIPTFGRPDIVQRAIHSVEPDPAQRVEIIVVDDHSPEDVRPHLPAVNQHGVPVRALRLSRNRGPQAARNLGLRRARYTYVGFLDSDDAFLPGKAEHVLRTLEDQDIDFLFHTVRGMDSYARLSRLWEQRLSWVPLKWIAAAYNPAGPLAIVVRRKQALGVEKFRHCEDYAFLLHYLEGTNKVLFLDEQLSTVYRPVGSEGGLSGNRWKMRKGEFQARQLLLRRPTADNIIRFGIGSMAGATRVLADLLRGRYF